MQNFQIIDIPEGCQFTAETTSSKFSLDLPIPGDDAKALILAAFRSPDEKPRAELHGVLADRTVDGVRVRIVAQNHVMDIPWPVIARELA